MGDGGAEKNHKSELGDLVPERKGMGEVVVSKIFTEVGVKMATPWGRMRGEIPMRE
jgi:hypothetical protein